jgi:hypothetical protein
MVLVAREQTRDRTLVPPAAARAVGQALELGGDRTHAPPVSPKRERGADGHLLDLVLDETAAVRRIDLEAVGHLPHPLASR